MATPILQPIWHRITQSFTDRITGDVISLASAVPFLRAYPSVRGARDVVIRDVLGRFVPSRLFGGAVLAHFPTGMGEVVGVTRVLPISPEDFLYRARDVMHSLVHYRIEGGPLQETWVTMRKGEAWDEAVFQERFMDRIVERDPETYEEVGPVPDYEIVSREYSVTSYYASGAYLGEDIERFGGLQ